MNAKTPTTLHTNLTPAVNRPMTSKRTKGRIKGIEFGPSFPEYDKNKTYYWIRVEGTDHKNPAVLGEMIDYLSPFDLPMDTKIAVVVNYDGVKKVLMVECSFCDMALSYSFTFKNLFNQSVINVPIREVKEVFKILQVVEDMDLLKV